MNKLICSLIALLTLSVIATPANAVGDSAIHVTGTVDPGRGGGYPGQLYTTQVSVVYVTVCGTCTLTLTFSHVTSEVEVTVNGEAEFLQPGIAYTFSDFTGQITVVRQPNSNIYEFEINGHGTITSA